jgi:DNA-binding LacI/PurR family transcriptional regulator
MADVARLAGVSVSTVSYVLSGERPISQATKERIERAMSELGYTPNVLARGLKSKRSRIIALLFPVSGLQLGLSSVEYILAASDQVQSRNYHLLLWTGDAGSVKSLSGLAAQGLVDGVLVMEVQLTDARLSILQEAGLAISMIGRTEDTKNFNFVDADFDHCAQLAMRHLTELGHQHIGFLTLASSVLVSRRGNAIRLGEGLTKAAAHNGAELHMVPCESTFVAGRAAFAQLLAVDPELSAVIAFNEHAVTGLMAAAGDLGRRVPDDLSVVSIDMPMQLAMMTNPPMTTVGPSAAAMGRAAADILIRTLEGVPGNHHQELFKGELNLRGTTATVRNRTG